MGPRLCQILGRLKEHYEDENNSEVFKLAEKEVQGCPLESLIQNLL